MGTKSLHGVNVITRFNFYDGVSTLHAVAQILGISKYEYRNCLPSESWFKEHVDNLMDVVYFAPLAKGEGLRAP